MRGFPPLHLLVFMLAFAVFSIPLVKLTSGQNQVRPVEQAPATSATEVPKLPGYLRFKFAHLPTSLKFEVDGKTLVSTEDLEDSQTLEKEIVIVAEPQEMEGLLHVTWQEGTPETAVTIEWEPESHDSVQATFWGETEMDEVVKLRWK